MVSLSTVYGSLSRDSTVTLSLTVTISEPTPGTQTSTQYPFNILIDMANDLPNPGNGDIEFQFSGENGNVKSLFTHKPILKARCEEYYSASKPPN